MYTANLIPVIRLALLCAIVVSAAALDIGAANQYADHELRQEFDLKAEFDLLDFEPSEVDEPLVQEDYTNYKSGDVANAQGIE